MKHSICLNMIVKNESPVIRRCLESVKSIIDYWVIVDTGSTDQTQNIIREFLKDIPGELYERPWQDFEHNRNEALKLAKTKGDYLLLMDADDTLQIDPNFHLPDTELDCYESLIFFCGVQYDRPLLIKNSLDWAWHGVLHEYLSCPHPISLKRIEGIRRICHPDGFRSKNPKKYQHDVQVLEKALVNDPTNSRYVFYLAQSYRDAGDIESSLKTYEKRAAMGGWDEEVFFSKLQIANMQSLLKKDSETVIKSYYDAYHYRPSRAEPLYYLTQYYRARGEYIKGHLVASIGMAVPSSNDRLFVEKWIYDFGLKFEYSICAYWIGNYAECQRLCLELLEKSVLPPEFREAVQRNISYANQKLVEQLQKCG